MLIIESGGRTAGGRGNAWRKDEGEKRGNECHDRSTKDGTEKLSGSHA